MPVKFYTSAGQPFSDPAVEAAYRAARAIGVVRVGGGRLFFRAGLRVYALEAGELRRCYRRVMRVPMKLCCGEGSLDVETLVVEGEVGELASVQLPGTRAARALMEALAAAFPGVALTPPERPESPEANA